MRLVSNEKDQYQFHLGKREKELLTGVLKLYPCLPPGHHQLSKLSAPEASNQQLLDEALAEQRAQSQKQLAALLQEHHRWIEQHSGWRLTVAAAELEWLLQVLNDIRVGSWVLLGSPEKQVETLSTETAPHLWAMEIAGSFQMALLHALEGGGHAV